MVKLGTCWEPLDPDPVAGYQLVGQSDQHSGTQRTESENERAPLVSPPPPNVSHVGVWQARVTWFHLRGASALDQNGTPWAAILAQEPK